MRYLAPKYPNVYCLRFDKPFAVTPQQFQEWNSDNESCEAISKEEFIQFCKISLEERKDKVRRMKMLEPIFAEIFTPYVFK